MNNVLKLTYVMLMPVVIIVFYDNVIVQNWAGWSAQYPSIAGVPRWAVLAVAVALYAVNVWVLIGLDWFREFRNNREQHRRALKLLKPQEGKVLQFPRD